MYVCCFKGWQCSLGGDCTSSLISIGYHQSERSLAQARHYCCGLSISRPLHSHGRCGSITFDSCYCQPIPNIIPKFQSCPTRYIVTSAAPLTAKIVRDRYPVIFLKEERFSESCATY